MGLFSFFRLVGQTGSFSEAYLVSVSGTSPRDYAMRTEIMRDDAPGKGPRRVVIHQGRGREAERDYWGGRWRQDIRDTARDTSPQRMETDWRQPYGHPPANRPGGWVW
jgi:hypothetical protein